MFRPLDGTAYSVNVLDPSHAVVISWSPSTHDLPIAAITSTKAPRDREKTASLNTKFASGNHSFVWGDRQSLVVYVHTFDTSKVMELVVHV